MIWNYDHYCKWRSWRCRVSLTNFIIQIGPHVCLYIRAVRSSLVESHWWVYQCLYLTLVSLLLTFILVIAHVSSAIHLVCCIYTTIKYCNCKLPLESLVVLDFDVRSRRLSANVCVYIHKNSLFIIVYVDRLSLSLCLSLSLNFPLQLGGALLTLFLLVWNQMRGA